MLSLFRKPYRHLNKILISQEALIHNHYVLQEFHPEAKICPVLKSNAYGHGLKTVAPVFEKLAVPFLVVDSLFEAYGLQKTGVRTPILILGYTHPHNFTVKKLPFHVTVFDLELARVLNEYQRGCSIHLFVDTGMCREGIQLHELKGFLEQLKKCTNLKVVGLATHLADADNDVSAQSMNEQLKRFQEAIDLVHQAGYEPQWHHLSASGGAFKIKNRAFNLIRAGLASYGVNPLLKNDQAYDQLNLRPALTFMSTLAQIKTVPAGSLVGYNGTFIAEREMRLGLLPAGYYEGVDRRLSNKGLVTINGAECFIIGRVSMNMTVVDLLNAPNAMVGDEVVIYDTSLNAKNTIVEAAQSAGTIPYELLVHLAESVRRELE